MSEGISGEHVSGYATPYGAEYAVTLGISAALTPRLLQPNEIAVHERQNYCSGDYKPEIQNARFDDVHEVLATSRTLLVCDWSHSPKWSSYSDTLRPAPPAPALDFSSGTKVYTHCASSEQAPLNTKHAGKDNTKGA